MQVSIEMTIRCILVNHKCFSVHFAIEDNRNNYEITYKDVGPT